MTRLRISELVFFGINVVFMTVAFLFIEWLQAYAGGNLEAEFSFASLASVWSWVVIIAQSSLATYIVSFIITQGYNMRKKRKTSDLCQTLRTNEMRVDKIYADRRFSDLNAAIERINARSKQECFLRHMKKINSHIELEDISALLAETDIVKGVADFKKKFCSTDIKEKAFDNAVKKLITGKFKDYETFSANDLLSKGMFEKGKSEVSLKDKRRKVKNWLLTQKAVTSILFGAALSIIVSELIIEFTIVSTIANMIYIFFAIAGGVYSLMNYCNYVEGVFEKRNGVIEEELGITDKWLPPEPEEEE